MGRVVREVREGEGSHGARGRTRTPNPLGVNQPLWLWSYSRDGGPRRVRTADALLFRQPLYRLSYRPMNSDVVLAGDSVDLDHCRLS